jgi:hypothetical protein
MTTTAEQAQQDYRNGAAQRDPRAVADATREAVRHGAQSAGSERGGAR